MNEESKCCTVQTEEVIVHNWPEPHSLEVRSFEFAKAGNLDELSELFKTCGSGDINKQFFLDMAIMGAHEGKVKSTYDWALKNGASLLWGIQQPKPKWIYTRDKSLTYGKNISMLKGPGEVSKGTFK